MLLILLRPVCDCSGAKDKTLSVASSLLFVTEAESALTQAAFSAPES